MAAVTGRRRQVDLVCEAFSRANHRVGTKGERGACSWREDCVSPPVVSATVTYLDTQRSLVYALCELDHLRLHQYFDVRHPAPVDEAKHLLGHMAVRFAAGCRTAPTHPLDPERHGAVTFGSRDVQLDESSAFLAAWRQELVEVNEDGSFTLSRCAVCPPVLHLIGRSGAATALHTEYLIHIGVVAELVLEHRWEMKQLAFEQGEWDVIGTSQGRVTLLVEAKARSGRPDRDSLESLRKSLVALAADRGASAPANHLRKFRELERHLHHGPIDVLLVASGARWWFAASMSRGGDVVLRELAF